MLIDKNNSLATSKLRRRAAWIAIAPIALLQLTIGLHQLDHAAESIQDTCHVCVQLDRIVSAVDHSIESVPLLPADLVKLESPSVIFSRNAVRNFDTRAPPQF